MTHSSLATRTQWTTDRSSRSGRKIDRFIIHHAATTSLSGILSLFQPGGRTVSANYALKDNDLVATVPEEYRAWTSSSTEWDGRAVTIEVANSNSGGKWPVSDASFRMLARLIADVAKRYGFAINDNTVLTHQELYLRYGASYATACPGDLQRRKAELLKLANDFLKGTTASTPAPAKPSQGTLTISKWPQAVYTLKTGDSEQAVLKMFGMSQTRFRNLNNKPNGWGKGQWPAGLAVKVALDHAPLTYQYLQKGQSWTEAKLVLATAQTQNRLRTAYPSYAKNLDVDGKFGDDSERVVIEFQGRTEGLGKSGKVDRNTWNKIHAVQASAPTPAPTTPKTATYKVKAGDTFWAISKATGLSVDELKRLNPGIKETALPVGKELKLAEGKTHKIVSGDTLWALSKKYNTTVDALETLNPDVEASELIVGTELVVK